jgi:hypothetical protein
MGEKLLGMITWMLAGYLIGLTVGFSIFDPNTDIYALLGAVLAILGLLLGLTPLFRRYTRLALGGITGFYLGAMLGIILLGHPVADDLLEVAGSGSKLLVALAGMVIGIVAIYRFGRQINSLLIAAFLFGGFFGALLLNMVGIAPRLSMVYTAPYFIGCGVLCAGIVIFLQRQRLSRSNPI